MSDKFKIHKYCEIFPSIVGEEREKLKADIAENGLQDPIWRWGQIVIDGKNRLEICTELGMTPDFRDWRPSAKAVSQAQQEAEVLRFAIAKNLHRRHLTESQRAMLAAKVATKPEGRPELTSSVELVSQDDAAKQFDVSVPSVKRATIVQNNADASVVAAVVDGTATVRDGAAIANEPKAVQRKAVKAVKAGKAKTLKAAIREPGDDPPERRHRGSVQNGKATVVPPKIDARGVHAEFGVLARAVDTFARAAALNNSPHHRATMDSLSAALTSFQKLAEATEKNRR